MKKFISFVIAIIMAGTACSTTVEKSGSDIKEPPSKVIKVGETTKDEVIRFYGDPATVNMKENEEELIYESKKVETPSFLGGLIINEAGKNVTLKRLEVMIKDGIVQSYKYEAK